MEDLKKLIVAFVTLFLCLPLGAFFIKYLKYEENIDSVYSGTIVNKKIVNPENGLFTSHGTQYYIVVGTEYDKPTLFSNSESKKGTKSISVNENVYLKYNVGDFFDSHNYTTTSEE